MNPPEGESKRSAIWSGPDGGLVVVPEHLDKINKKKNILGQETSLDIKPGVMGFVC